MPEIHKPHEKNKNKIKHQRDYMRGNGKAWYKFL